jgi:hypothetical protein
MAVVTAFGTLDPWPVSNVTESMLQACVDADLLRPRLESELLKWIIPVVNVRAPNPPPGYVVSFLVFHDRGFRVLAGRFM